MSTKRLIFSCNDDQLPAVAETLAQPHLQGWRCNVLSEEDGKVQRLGLPSAGAWLRSDLRDGALRGGLAGLLAGVISALFIAAGWVLESPLLLAILFYALPLTLMFSGAWWGGMLGLMQNNPSLASFLELLDRGDFVILVESTPVDERLIKRVMAMAGAVLIAEQPKSWGRFEPAPILPLHRGGA